MTSTYFRLPGVILALALFLGGCGTVESARVALPEGLAERSDIVELPKIGTGRHGRADVLGQTLQFERSASRLALFDDFSVAQRSALRYSLIGGSGEPTVADCSVRRRTMAVGIVEWTAKPLTLACHFTSTGARLNLDEHRPGLGTLKIDRRGQLSVGGRNFSVRSLHRAQGGLFELAQPIGYVVEDLGRPVAAVETNGRRPRLFLPTDDPGLRQASLHALLALALMWDVGDG